jgi:hypothetical protein
MDKDVFSLKDFQFETVKFSSIYHLLYHNIAKKAQKSMFYEIFSRKTHFLCIILLKIFDSEDIESEGTLKILNLPGPIVDTLVNGMGQPEQRATDIRHPRHEPAKQRDIAA